MRSLQPLGEEQVHIVRVNELAAALAKAQGEIKTAVKDSANPFYKSTYADLASVWDACRTPLSKYGLSVTQTTDVTDAGTTILVTTLLHSSGQLIQGRYPVHPVKPDPQALGSALSYARRYALQAIVGVAPDDDDGEAAMERAARTKAIHETVTAPPAAVPKSPPGEYVVPFGKYVNKKIKELTRETISKDVTYWRGRETAGEVLGGKAKECVEAMEAYLGGKP